LDQRLDSQAKPAAIPTFARPARRSPSFAPGLLMAGDSAQSASVAISVPRNQASAHQSRRDRMGGGEGEPDRGAAPEQVGGVGRGLVVAEDLQRRLGRRERAGAERQVEGDHVAVGEAQRPLERHCPLNPTRSRPIGRNVVARNPVDLT
jgi:hypothetical protein